MTAPLRVLLVSFVFTALAVSPPVHGQVAAEPFAPGQAASEHVIAAELGRALQAAGPTETLEAYLVMRDQLPARDLARLPATSDRRLHKRRIADRLKSHAAASQVQVRALLDSARASGAADDIRELWMGNAVVFSARPAVIRELAGLPGVDRIQLIVNEDPEVYQDAGPPPPLGVGTYPFSDDFETGVLQPHWTVEVTGNGYAEVSADNGPEDGFHLVMATSVDGTDSTASMTVGLDLTGQTDVGIRFRHKEFGDENDFEDGVFVSEDGLTWHQVLSLQNGSSNYETKVIQLDQAAAALGLSYTASFQIRFQWGDNFNVPTDGFAFDSIEIAPGAGVPPPADPEPNVLALQAPQLWEIGFDGSDVLLGNIDSGVFWTHPDLINRIWVNPGEIADNSIDDDNNGFVDDVHGWDFFHNNADVSSTDPHGTQTSGIAVGDGTSGRGTGMAPGATMVACEVSGEATYWLAQQYLLDVGVDVITSSYSYKWPSSPKPDYHMHRQMCEIELAAGVIHANSIGNQGGLLTTYPIPFNISTPGNCPAPFTHPDSIGGGATSVMACGGIKLPNDAPYSNSGRGPATWEDIALYDPGYPHAQDNTAWDYPYGGFGGGQAGLIKPDVVTYTDTVITTTIGSGYANFGGTSAATPHLGGAMALLRQVQPEAEPRHIAGALQLTALDLGTPGKDNQFGAGKLQVFAAARRLVLLVKALDPEPSLGGDVTFELYGQPNSFVHGYLSGSLVADDPKWNLLQPHIKLGIFLLDANGRETLTFGIPNDPILEGLQAWLQFGHQVQGDDWGNGPLTSVPERITVVN